MKILFLYQDIVSGSNISAGSLIRNYQRLYPEDECIVYQQKARVASGKLSFAINLCWSVFDYWRVINFTSTDIIYSTVYTFAIAKRFTKHMNTPSVFHVHGDQAFSQNTDTNAISGAYRLCMSKIVLWLQAYAIKSSTKLCHVSEKAMQDFFSRYDLLNCTEKSAIIPNGVDTRLFAPVSRLWKTQLQRSLGLPKGFVISYVGRIDEKKGIIGIAKALRFIHANVLFVIAHPICDDEYSQTYYKRLQNEAASLKRKMFFMENPKDISTIYKASDCLVLPSKQEMAPLVVLESLACGVLPLCTDVGNNKLILGKLWKYAVLPSQNTQSIASKISVFIRLPESQKNSISKNCRALVTNFSWARSAKKLKRVFITVNQS